MMQRFWFDPQKRFWGKPFTDGSRWNLRKRFSRFLLALHLFGQLLVFVCSYTKRRYFKGLNSFSYKKSLHFCSCSSRVSGYIWISKYVLRTYCSFDALCGSSVLELGHINTFYSVNVLTVCCWRDIVDWCSLLFHPDSVVSADWPSGTLSHFIIHQEPITSKHAQK